MSEDAYEDPATARRSPARRCSVTRSTRGATAATPVTSTTRRARRRSGSRPAVRARVADDDAQRARARASRPRGSRREPAAAQAPGRERRRRRARRARQVRRRERPGLCRYPVMDRTRGRLRGGGGDPGAAAPSSSPGGRRATRARALEAERHDHPAVRGEAGPGDEPGVPREGRPSPSATSITCTAPSAPCVKILRPSADRVNPSSLPSGPTSGARCSPVAASMRRSCVSPPLRSSSVRRRRRSRPARRRGRPRRRRGTSRPRGATGGPCGRRSRWRATCRRPRTRGR
jgi:hypothetical protein